LLEIVLEARLEQNATTARRIDRPTSLFHPTSGAWRLAKWSGLARPTIS